MTPAPKISAKIVELGQTYVDPSGIGAAVKVDLLSDRRRYGTASVGLVWLPLEGLTFGPAASVECRRHGPEGENLPSLPLSPWELAAVVDAVEPIVALELEIRLPTARIQAAGSR